MSSTHEFMWFAPEFRFLPLIDEGERGPAPDDAAHAKAGRLTALLRESLRARSVPPLEVTRWMDDADLASVGLARHPMGGGAVTRLPGDGEPSLREAAWAQPMRWFLAMHDIAHDSGCGPEWQARYGAAFERVCVLIQREYAALADMERDEQRTTGRPTELRLVARNATEHC
jgi:hypothetical protein